MQLIDGKAVADRIKQEIAQEVADIGGKRPHLAAVLVGHDGGSETYVAHKVKACEQCGFKSTLIRYENDVTEEELLRKVDELNNDPDIDGFIVQLPLPKHISEQKVIEAIDYRKDVDGFHPVNVGRMSIGLPCFVSATPAGIMELLARYEIETKGKHCVVLGRSNIVGKPVATLMMQKAYPGNATVTVCHSATPNIKEICRTADIIIAALGESSEMSGESSSRSELGIPDTQRALLEALLATGKPVVLTLFTGRLLTLCWEQEHVPAILNVWFGGSEAAYAIGDVLFGDVNPSGKLTMSFPKNVGQIPIYYAHKNSGRPLAEGHWFEKFRSNYLDVDNEPLYPFGYGLSYTTFQYSDVSLSSHTLGSNGSITATVTLTNNGQRDGAEVVQLYIHDLVGSSTRPVRELRGFQKVFLKAGESRQITFQITPDLLRYYNYELQHVAEPGDFDVMIGGNSQQLKSARFTLK